MFSLEVKRSIHNNTIVYLMTVTATAFIMGWALPFGIEKIVYIDAAYYMFSTYTVFTQFGFLLFGFVTSYYFNKDYREKNTIFYKSFDVNALKFYLMKVAILLIEEFACIFVDLIIVSILLGTWRYFTVSLGLFSIVVFQYFIIVGAISLIFRSTLVSLGVSIIYWILSIVLSSFGGVLKYFSSFDASNTLYRFVENYFRNDDKIPISALVDGMMEYGILLAVVTIIILCISPKWVRKGL